MVGIDTIQQNPTYKNWISIHIHCLAYSILPSGGWLYAKPRAAVIIMFELAAFLQRLMRYTYIIQCTLSSYTPKAHSVVPYGLQPLVVIMCTLELIKIAKL